MWRSPIIRKLACSCLTVAAVWAGPAFALTGSDTVAGLEAASFTGTTDPAILLAQDAGKTPETVQPLPGELVIPQNSLKAEPESGGEGEKKCMTVCARWGEECMLINKGAGGMERKCRRTCKQLGEECL